MKQNRNDIETNSKQNRNDIETNSKQNRKDEKTIYYSYAPILSKMDIDGLLPAIYMVVSNRSAGKTFGALELMLDDFINENKQFCLLYRTREELSGASAIFNDVLSFRGSQKEMTQKSNSNGLFYTLFLDEKPCGFAISIRQPDKVKKYSGMFCKVFNVLFDEFILEDGQYIKNEDSKLFSVLMTIARGGGKQSRYVRTFMLGNNVSMINPYFLRFGILDRKKDNTKFLRGNGWICEFNVNESAKKAVLDNPIARAFGGADLDYIANGAWLNDNDKFIKKLSGNAKYYCSVGIDNSIYGVYLQNNAFYINKKYNLDSGKCYVFRTEDMSLENEFSREMFKIFRERALRGMVFYENIKIRKDFEKVLSIAY